jgi:hypothetical protein
MRTRGYSGGGQRLRDKSNQRVTHRWNNHVTCPEMDFVIDHRGDAAHSHTVHISTERWPSHRPHQDILGTYRWTPYVITQHVTYHDNDPRKSPVKPYPKLDQYRKKRCSTGHESMPVHQSRLLILTCLSTSSIFAAVNMHPNITICCTSCLRVQLPNILMLNIVLEYG